MFFHLYDLLFVQLMIFCYNSLFKYQTKLETSQNNEERKFGLISAHFIHQYNLQNICGSDATIVATILKIMKWG